MSTLISYATSETDARAATSETIYSLKVINQSSQSWIFYLYQTLPQQLHGVFSLVWFASPYLIRVNTQITFHWMADYSFVWADTGVLVPSVIFDTNGVQPAEPEGANTTQFNLKDGPGLSPPMPGVTSGSLAIENGTDVPPNQFAVGIGMSGMATFIWQALPGYITKIVPSPPNYWVAAGLNERVGQVLDTDTIAQAAPVQFPPNVFDLQANISRRWSVDRHPCFTRVRSASCERGIMTTSHERSPRFRLT